jgi:hypothetical protein
MANRTRGQKGEGNQEVATQDLIDAIERELAAQKKKRRWLAQQVECTPSNLSKVLKVGERSSFIPKIRSVLNLDASGAPTSSRHTTALAFLDRIVATNPDRYMHYVSALGEAAEAEERAASRLKTFRENTLEKKRDK